MVKRAGQPRYATFSMEFERDKILAKVKFGQFFFFKFVDQNKFNSKNELKHCFYIVLYMISNKF